MQLINKLNKRWNKRKAIFDLFCGIDENLTHQMALVVRGVKMKATSGPLDRKPQKPEPFFWSKLEGNYNKFFKIMFLLCLLDRYEV